MTTTTKLTFARLRAASADVGFCQPPGGGRADKTCTIYARRDGRWEAEGSVKTGGNQGYFQVDYEYGPWRGRGDTPAEAVAAMVRRADDDWQDDMRKAGHDALLECEGTTFATLAAAEADRIQGVLDKGSTHSRVRIGDHSFGEQPADEADELRRRAVKALRRLAGEPESPLAGVSDESLLAELRSRGLV